MAIISAQIKTTNTEILDPTGVGTPAGAVPTGKTYAITNILICNNSQYYRKIIVNLLWLIEKLSLSSNASLFDLLLPFEVSADILFFLDKAYLSTAFG